MQMLGRVALLTAVSALLMMAGGPAQAASCIKAGGWGTGVLENFASFMAEAAMKNQAKAWGGEAVKIGKVSKTCEWKTVAYECTARARACK
jgi:hypothetical protein